MGIRICPKCNGKVSTARNICIHCGYGFPTLKRCPDCAETVPIDAAECPVCGYPFLPDAIIDPVFVDGEEPENRAPVHEEAVDSAPSSRKEEPVIEEITETAAENSVPADAGTEFAAGIAAATAVLRESVPEAPVTLPPTEKVAPAEKKKPVTRTECPYCSSADVTEIGAGNFWCMTCKGKFLCSAATGNEDIFSALPDRKKKAPAGSEKTAPSDPDTDHTGGKKVGKILLICLLLLLVAGGIVFGIIRLRSGGSPEIIKFGKYEQDNNTGNGKEDIEWLVLAKDGNKALVISKYALDCQPYNTSDTDITWETCTLRTWLNGTFYNSAFSDAEKSRIVKSTVSADRNPEYSITNPGNATSDNVFLLSITEAEKCFSSDKARRCAPTAYAKAQGIWTGSNYKTASGEVACNWWLRSPGRKQFLAADVYTDGSVNYYGYGVAYDADAVRPALWINLDS